MTCRPRWAPLVAAVVGVGFVSIVGSIGAAQGQDRRGLDAIAVGLLLLSSAALALRDRHLATLVAFTCTAIFIGRGHPFGPVFAAPFIGLFTAGLTPRRKQTWAVGAIGALLILFAATASDDDVGLIHVGAVFGWTAAFMAVAEVVRNRRAEMMERGRRQAGEQRLHMAQELHDVLAHDISLINVQASTALHLIDEKPEQARIALAAIKEASRDALHELRSALDVLRSGDDAPRAPAPTLAGLPALVDGVRASGLDVRLDVADLPPLSKSVELAAYRIVQEALTNVTRHARATSAHVTVIHGDALHVKVVDDGVGGTPLAGNGLTGMERRATSLGGTFDAGPTTNGFAVRATLPT